MKLGKEDRLYYLAEDLLSGALQVGYENLSGEYGYYDQGGATITISRALMGGGKEGSAKLAAALAHEGTHAYGNRVEGLAHMEALGTYSDIVAMFKLKGDASFASEMLSGVMAAENWSENTGDRDYWKFDAKKKQWSWDKDFDFTVGEHKISAENMQQYIAAQKAAAAIAGTFNLSVGSGEKPGVYIRSAGKRESNGYTALFDAFILSGGDVLAQYDRFLDGTGHFADASVQAKTMIAGDITQDGIDKMNAALYAAQESGLLKKNPNSSKDFSRIINLGQVLIPVELGHDQISHDISSLFGYRVIDTKRGLTFHSGIDLRGISDSNIIAGVNGESSELKYDSIYGLNVTERFSLNNRSYKNILSHLEKIPTLESYFINFSTEGISLRKNRLEGLTAGTVIGNIGHTGYSFGDHLDWRTFENGKLVNPLKSTLYGDYLSNKATITYEAIKLSGYTTGTMDNIFYKNIKDYFYNSRDTNFIWNFYNRWGIK